MNDSKKKLIWLLAVMISLFALAACQPAEAVFDGADGELSPTAELIVDADSDGVAVDVNDLIDSGAASVEPIVWDDATTTASGLQYIEVTVGSGSSPQEGDMVSMHYVATLPDGTMLAELLLYGTARRCDHGTESTSPRLGGRRNADASWQQDANALAP